MEGATSAPAWTAAHDGPDDRLWRHPSEVAGSGPGLEPPFRYNGPPRHNYRSAVMVLVGVGAVMAVVGVALLTVIGAHPLGNGAAIFTGSGALARRFVDEVETGQIGVNVPIPFPVFFHNFAGWKDSAFTETKLFGPAAITFHTRTKTVSARWPEAPSSRVDLAFPMPH